MAQLAGARHRRSRGAAPRPLPDPWRARASSAHYQHALTHERLGEPERALEDLARALEIDATFADALEARARLRGRQGDWRGVVDDLTAALPRAGRRQAVVLKARAQAHMNLRDLGAAERDATDALALLPDALETLELRAVVRGALTDLDGACRDLDRLIAREPTPRASSFAARAEMRRQAGDATGAADDATRAIALDGRHVVALLTRGIVRGMSCDTEGALADFAALLELRPDSTYVQGARALVLVDAGQLAAAEQALTAALARGPVAIVLAARARAHLHAGELRAGLDDAERALAAEPTCAPALTSRALLRDASGDADGASEDLARALALAPHDVVALTGRARMHLARRDAAAAEADAARALAIAPTWAPALAVRDEARRVLRAR